MKHELGEGSFERKKKREPKFLKLKVSTPPDCCCLVRELKKGLPLFSMLASVSVYPLPHFFLLFLSCPVYLNGLTLVMGFFGALVRPLLLLATPTTCCHKRESFESRTGWLPATETLLCC